jgi:hypothetical protein
MVEPFTFGRILASERDAENPLTASGGNVVRNPRWHLCVAEAGGEAADQVDGTASFMPSSGGSAFEVITSPSDAATTRRTSTGAKSSNADPILNRD